MKILRNRGASSSLEYVDGRRAYTEWHWGLAPEFVTEYNDPRRDGKGRDVLPRLLVECGRLRELKFLMPDTSKSGTFHPVNHATCHLTFDPEHPCGRLHILLDAKSEAKSIEQLVRKEYPSLLKTLDVEVSKGIVTLHGNLRSRREVDKVLSSVLMVDGVTDIQSEITVGGLSYVRKK